MNYPVHEFKDKWYNAQGFGVKTDYGFHEGVDLNLKTGGDTDLGQELLAVADGEVTSVEGHTKVPSFGRHLHLKCETAFGTRWFNYCHCQDILVSEGTKVKEGQLIAHLGKTGTTVAHLHFACKNQPTGVDALATNEEELKKWEDPILFIEKVNEPSKPPPDPQNGINERVTAVEIGLDKVNDELGKNTRRLDEIQRSVDVVSGDRAILEDIQGKLTELKEAIKINSDNLSSTKKELRDEFRVNVELMDNRIKQLENPPMAGEGKRFDILFKIGKLFLGRRK